jgi:hypothetical protein
MSRFGESIWSAGIARNLGSTSLNAAWPACGSNVRDAGGFLVGMNNVFPSAPHPRQENYRLCPKPRVCTGLPAETEKSRKRNPIDQAYLVRVNPPSVAGGQHDQMS